MWNKKGIITVPLICLALASSPVMAQVGNSNSTSGSTASGVGTSKSSANANVGTSSSNSNVGTSRSTATGGKGGTASASAGAASASTGPTTINLYGTGSGSDPNGTGAASAATTAATLGTPGMPYTTSSSTSVSGTQTIRNTPDVSAPATFGGTNPCSVGASGGIGVPGLGFSGGYTWSDHGCERRNTAVILFQANKARVAFALLCEDKETRAAFLAAEDPCPQDLAVARAAAAPSPAPAAVVAVPTVQKVSGYMGSKPSWCDEAIKDTTDAASHQYYCRDRS